MSNLLAMPTPNNNIGHEFRESTVEIDPEYGAAVVSMHPSPRPSFTPGLLGEIEEFFGSAADTVRTDIDRTGSSSIRYLVLASDMPGIFNFGGDLNRFVELIRESDREGLMEYALSCIRCTHSFSQGWGVPATSIALVQGRAQGGGFEAALAANVLIAERGTQLGFPEVLFNLFPGMGAYSFLSRKVSPAIAERLILSGTLYDAEYLYEIGAVDVLAEPGEGQNRLRSFMKEADKHNHVHGLMRRIRATHNEVPFEELREITELWVESALRLGDRDLRTMERLVRAQDRRVGVPARKAN
jgi:DSF synthase